MRLIDGIHDGITIDSSNDTSVVSDFVDLRIIIELDDTGLIIIP